LFWNSSPAAQKYEVYIDDAKAGEVPAAPVPVLHYSVAQPLPVGPHHWSIKGIPATGDAVTSATSTFTIDPPVNWPAWAIGPFQRYGKNPILSPQGTGWESVNTFNPGVIFDQGKFRMLYRAQGKGWPSKEGYAESLDGVTFTSNPEPIIDSTEPFEQNYGCEDARLFHDKDTYYAIYTGNNLPEPDKTPAAGTSAAAGTNGTAPPAPKKKRGGGIALCEATSLNGKDWKKLGIIVGHTKNGAMICDTNGTPVKINGKYAMFVGNSRIGICYSDDLTTWTPIQKIDAKLPKGWVGPWEPCVAVTNFSKTAPDNIVLFVAGTLNGKGKWFYAISEMLFSKADLTKKVDQLDDCIMKPEQPYESGQNKNCLWMNCIIAREGQWIMYYGAGDRYVALATTPVK
jgi:predicted GH43/DUF377 family glycosyl hydrolase